MAFISEVRDSVERLAALAALDVDAASLPVVVAALSDSRLLDVLGQAALLANSVERLRVVAAGAVAVRSSRERGHAGLAAVQGHRTPASLVQSVSGGTKADADRHVRLGSAVIAGAVGPAAGDSPDAESPATDAAEPAARSDVVLPPWDDGLRTALLAGELTAAQHDAIRRGLGDPPGRGDSQERTGSRQPVVETGADTDAAACAAWMLAAEHLREEAFRFSVEELLRRARQVRDALDPIGVEERFAERYARRSFRTWTDAEGQHHAHLSLDDEMAAWVRAITDAALRPRRGGPRFVDAGEAVEAARLVDDPRTNDQLAYDLITDLLRAGAVATTEQVFGVRQPGVRVVTVTSANARDDGGRDGGRDGGGATGTDGAGATGTDGAGAKGTDGAGAGVGQDRLHPIAHLEDGGDALPGSVAERLVCLTGTVPVTVDARGNPLDVGRELRLFTPRQRIALAIRDGGCRHPGCAVVASSCEAHHIDHWHRDHGRTDVDRGVLLCRFHHMLLHNNGWSITRVGRGPFVLHPPPGARDGRPVELTSRSAARWAWEPPPDRAGWRAGEPA